MSRQLYMIFKTVNAISFMVLLGAGSFFLFRALNTISVSGEIQPSTGSFFFKGVNLLALFVLPFFSFIFLKRTHSLYNVLILTCINAAIALWLLQGLLL
jgi:hypothetical protein